MQKRFCDEAINAASNTGDFGLYSRALLAGAEGGLERKRRANRINIGDSSPGKICARSTIGIGMAGVGYCFTRQSTVR